MAKKNKPSTNGHPIYTGLPEGLEDILALAQANTRPPEPDEQEESVLALYRILSPVWVDVETEIETPTGKKKVTKKVLRQPLLMISWASNAGGWSVSVSDKTLAFRLSTVSECLATALQAINKAIEAGTIQVGEIIKH